MLADVNDESTASRCARACDFQPLRHPHAMYTATTQRLPGQRTHAKQNASVLRAQIYKIETPGEDPLLEIVVSLSNEKTTEATPSSTAAASEKRPAAASALPTPDTVGHRGEAPSVSISIDGISVVVDPNPDANGGARDEGGGGGKGGSDLSGMCSLQLPYRVVPRTAMSFFHGDTLTVRAVVAAAG